MQKLTRKQDISRLTALFACAYIGSAISAYGIVALSDSIGWQKTIVLWFVIALLAALFALPVSNPGKRR